MMDLHATDGAQFEHDIGVSIDAAHARDAPLRESAMAWRDGVVQALAAQGALALSFYPQFEPDNPAAGIDDAVWPPRYPMSYFRVRNRLGMLVEAHSWKDYPTRVRLTRQAVDAGLALVARHGRDWLRLARAADTQPPVDVVLSWRTEQAGREIEFRGYAYTRTPSEISGAPMVRYDESRPEIWRIPLRDSNVPQLVRKPPGAGYLVPVEHAARVGEKLGQHGLRFERLSASRMAVPVQAFRATAVAGDAVSFEGHQRLRLTGAWGPAARELPAGSLFVPIRQPLAALAMHLLEPDAPDSLAAWGHFATSFERKEHMEPYVAEQVAREQLAASPALRETFAARLRDDAAFAADPEARLEFFYRRSPSWDERFNLYPVLRVDAWPQPARKGRLVRRSRDE